MDVYKKAIKKVIPPFLIDFYNYYFNNRLTSKWHGNYPSWEAALQNTTSYSSQVIIDKCKQALLKVKNGQEIYERDSVIFDKIEYSWPLLSAILYVSLGSGNAISILDFGGSLGSTYFQNKKYLRGLKSLKYNIIEQDAFVKVGRECFEDADLKFYYSIEEYNRKNSPADLLIISSTLQYLENPKETIRYFLEFRIPYILVDFTPFSLTDPDRLTIQRVSPEIYEASYPCWILNYKDMIDIFLEDYELFSEHQNQVSIYLDGRPIKYSGFFLKLKDNVDEA